MNKIFLHAVSTSVYKITLSHLQEDSTMNCYLSNFLVELESETPLAKSIKTLQDILNEPYYRLLKIEC